VHFLKGNNAFADCAKLVKVTLPPEVKSIGAFAFWNTAWLKAEKEKNPLVVLGTVVIDGTSCKDKVIVPDSVTGITNNAFLYNYQITEIVIPDSVTSIGDTAFDNLNSLIIYGNKGSYALIFAEKHNVAFKVLEESLNGT